MHAESGLIASASGLRPASSSVSDEVDGVRRRRAAGDEDVHLHDLVHRPRPRQQRRDDGSSGSAWLSCRVLDVGAVAGSRFDLNGLRIAGTLPVTAQSPSDTSILVCARILRILFRSSSSADRAFDEGRRPRLGELLDVHQRAVDQSISSASIQQPLVHVQERHVAAGAAVQPDGRDLRLATHSRSSRISVRYGRNWRRLVISATDLPFSNSAPVGQTCTHLPQLGAGFATSPQGWFRSVMTCDVDAAAHDVPGVRAFDLVAHPHAARAQDAAVVVHREPLVRGVHAAACG